MQQEFPDTVPAKHWSTARGEIGIGLKDRDINFAKCHLERMRDLFSTRKKPKEHETGRHSGFLMRREFANLAAATRMAKAQSTL